jgi:hypothetical protein
MATHELPILGPNTLPGAGVWWDRVGNQITATNELGNQGCFVMEAVGADEGIYGSFNVPQNYVGTPVIVIKGILDGAPGANVDLGFAISGITIDDNEAVDAAYSSEDAAADTDIDDYADEDLYEETISLSNFTGFAVGDTVFFYFIIDDSGTDYAGNFLLTDLLFRYNDA